jgi:hypothetical protein
MAHARSKHHATCVVHNPSAPKSGRGRLGRLTDLEAWTLVQRVFCAALLGCDLKRFKSASSHSRFCGDWITMDRAFKKLVFLRTTTALLVLAHRRLHVVPDAPDNAVARSAISYLASWRITGPELKRARTDGHHLELIKANFLLTSSLSARMEHPRKG